MTVTRRPHGSHRAAGGRVLASRTGRAVPGRATAWGLRPPHTSSPAEGPGRPCVTLKRLLLPGCVSVCCACPLALGGG